MPHRFYRLAERLARMSFIIMVCWDIFSQTLKLGYTYMTNWCGATVVLHTYTLTGSVWATVSVCLWVSLGDGQSRCAQQVIELYAVCLSASSDLVPVGILQLCFRRELVGDLDRTAHCIHVYIMFVLVCLWVCLSSWNPWSWYSCRCCWTHSAHPNSVSDKVTPTPLNANSTQVIGNFQYFPSSSMMTWLFQLGL